MKLTDLSIGYDRSVIISGINEELMPGNFTCLLGRNGTGKSTLLKTLAGIIPAMAGEITIDGKRISDFSRQELAKRISLVLTHVPELPNTTLRELVSYGRLPYSSWLGKLSPDDLNVADTAIENLGITALAQRKICELSDGERQKAMIARALAQGTDYLLLDEPSAFLDYESKQELMSLLVRLAHEEHKTILLSTHDQELAMKNADHIWKIADRRLTEIIVG